MTGFPATEKKVPWSLLTGKPFAGAGTKVIKLIMWSAHLWQKISSHYVKLQPKKIQMRFPLFRSCWIRWISECPPQNSFDPLQRYWHGQTGKYSEKALSGFSQSGRFFVYLIWPILNAIALLCSCLFLLNLLSSVLAHSLSFDHLPSSILHTERDSRF